MWCRDVQVCLTGPCEMTTQVNRSKQRVSAFLMEHVQTLRLSTCSWLASLCYVIVLFRKQDTVCCCKLHACLLTSNSERQQGRTKWRDRGKEREFGVVEWEQLNVKELKVNNDMSCGTHTAHGQKSQILELKGLQHRQIWLAKRSEAAMRAMRGSHGYMCVGQVVYQVSMWSCSVTDLKCGEVQGHVILMDNMACSPGPQTLWGPWDNSLFVF